MFAWTSLALLVLATTWTNASKLHFYRSPDNRIIGGRPAREGEIPYQVSIRKFHGNNHNCGGSLITPKHVLSAAHCVVNRDDGTVVLPSEVTVVAGQLTVPITEDTVFRNASHITPHERYSSITGINDIAIIEVNEAFPTDSNPSIGVIRLRHAPIYTGACLVSGWGISHPEEIYTPVLLGSIVNMVNFYTCQDIYRPLISISQKYTVAEGMICAGQEHSAAGSCQGDSGGPLVCDGVLTGIVSKGKPPCTSPKYPGVYIEVAYYLPWIQAHIKSN